MKAFRTNKERPPTFKEGQWHMAEGRTREGKKYPISTKQKSGGKKNSNRTP